MKTRTFCLATLTLALAACSSTPERNSALEQARERLGSARADTQTTALAPDELRRASESLRDADQAWVAGGSKENIDHLAYMTSQRVAIAQETASSKASQAVVAGAAAERDRTRLAERTQEADSAQRELAQSQQNNDRKTGQLAEADANARRDKAAMDRSNARVSDLESELGALNAKKTDRGMVITLGGVLFYSGQSTLLAAGSEDMVRLAEFFKRNPSRTASIEGYTDSVGSSDSNLDLSGRRASAVMMALINLGVPADRLSTQAHGEDMPVASNDTAAGRQMNRRVEIVFAPRVDEMSSAK